MRRVVGSLSPIRGDHLAVRFHCDAFRHEVGAHHGLQVGGLVVLRVAAFFQRAGPEIRFAAQLHDPLGNEVGVGRFLVRVHQEFRGDRGGLQTVGREIVALVAQHAHEFGRQSIVQQLHDGVAVRTVRRCDGTFVEVLGGRVPKGFFRPG